MNFIQMECTKSAMVLNFNLWNFLKIMGNVQTYGEDLDFNFCDDGVKDTVFEAVILCNGVEKTITADYKLIY